MESLIGLLQGSLSYVIPMVILLGLLIFVHELGHFLVAKYFKVRIEVFSLGFGPKMFKFKRGDTVYAVSAIPLGGYVKMFGDEPNSEIDSDQKAFAFNHKPVGQRIAIVLAGPLMNFFFAILLFAGVAIVGEQTLAPKLGDIKTDSAAYQVGFRSGDTVLSVNSDPVRSWDQLQRAIERNPSNTLSVEVVRAEGHKATFEVIPKLTANKNILSWDRQVGEVDGLTFSARAPVVGIRDPNSPAGQAGLETGDLITSVNGISVQKWSQLKDVIGKISGDAGQPMKVTVERGLLAEKRAEELEKLTLQLPLPANDPLPRSGEELMAQLGIESPEVYLAGIEKDSPAAKAGLQKGDRLVSINGQLVTSFEGVAGIVRSFGEQAPQGQEPRPLQFTISRAGELRDLQISPNMRERMNHQGQEERRFEIGIRPLIIDAQPAVFELKSEGPLEAIARGFDQTMRWTSLTVLSFVRLFQNEVSAKNIGGFLSIGQMAQKSWQIGFNQFLTVMAIISINLFILNLLPVPVLDGGHLVFYSIEALRGAPLSMRKMEIAQQVGLVLLLGLMVFALFNDITRIISPS